MAQSAMDLLWSGRLDTGGDGALSRKPFIRLEVTQTDAVVAGAGAVIQLPVVGTRCIDGGHRGQIAEADKVKPETGRVLVQDRRQTVILRQKWRKLVVAESVHPQK